MTITYHENLRIGVQLMGVVEGEKLNVQEVLDLLETFLKLAIQMLLIIISVRDGITQVSQDWHKFRQSRMIPTQDVSVTHFFLFLKVVPPLCLILIGAFICGLK